MLISCIVTKGECLKNMASGEQSLNLACYIVFSFFYERLEEHLMLKNDEKIAFRACGCLTPGGLLIAKVTGVFNRLIYGSTPKKI